MQFTKTLIAATALFATAQATNNSTISSNSSYNGSANAAGSVKVSSSILGAAAAVVGFALLY
ncbi:hypothetical protein DASC09_006580 [Saccharomycopsis crataegensis]|uniref:Uncharacterized protein n=1 Tax=Saccharomycopsis crataegensis TaxID=43959 RepID=A0AAV5QES2_9ASCO|nr:hypothetical protein DASC09_006580 [Saccharomycopsis crataegensis]